MNDKGVVLKIIILQRIQKNKIKGLVKIPIEFKKPHFTYFYIYYKILIKNVSKQKINSNFISKKLNFLLYSVQ